MIMLNKKFSLSFIVIVIVQTVSSVRYIIRLSLQTVPPVRYIIRLSVLPLQPYDQFMNSYKMKYDK